MNHIDIDWNDGTLWGDDDFVGWSWVLFVDEQPTAFGHAFEDAESAALDAESYLLFNAIEAEVRMYNVGVDYE